jgi:uncharacterized protein YchJ
MSQSYAMPATAFERLSQAERDRFITKQLVGDQVIATEVFTGPTNRANFEAMDARAADLEQRADATRVHRAKLGRNSPCLCGSGLKLKKCCLHKSWVDRRLGGA